MALRTINSITQAEYDNMAMHWRKAEYSTQEGNELLAIVKMWINERQPTCFSCKGNFREMKGQFASWFLFNKEQFEAILAGPAIENIQPEQIVEEPKKVTKKKSK